MKIGYWFFILLIILFSASGFAEEKFPVTVHAGYFGEMGVHPGGTIGAGAEFLKAGRYSMAGEFSVFSYIHPLNHTAFAVRGDWVHRVTGKRGLSGEAGISLGYMHTWSRGDIYVQADDGTIAQSTNTGWPHLYTGLFIGTALDLRRPAAMPLAPYFRTLCFFEYPYNGFLLPHLAFELGIRIRIPL